MPVSAEGRVEHQKRNQMEAAQRLLPKRVFRLARGKMTNKPSKKINKKALKNKGVLEFSGNFICILIC